MFNLLTNRIREVKPNSIVTHDGDEYPVDIIIWSTGFEVQKFPLPIYGINGSFIIDQWSETMQVSFFLYEKKTNNCIKYFCFKGISWCNSA